MLGSKYIYWQVHQCIHLCILDVFICHFFIYLMKNQFVPCFISTVIDYSGPPKGESNYEEPMEFDPIGHHNQFCPWVNGNVAAAGNSSCGPDTSGDVVALCGWQLTLDALDALRSLGHVGIQTLESESAASLYKVFSRAHFYFGVVGPTTIRYKKIQLDVWSY